MYVLGEMEDARTEVKYRCGEVKIGPIAQRMCGLRYFTRINDEGFRGGPAEGVVAGEVMTQCAM